MAEPANQPDKRAMVKMLLPMGAIALVVVLVAVLWTMSGVGIVMSDGSNGTENDPGLSVASEGVRYRDLREGTGNAVKPGDTVRVKYKGWTPNGSVFDSKDFMEFSLHQVIQGWAEGMVGMRMGCTRKLVVSPDKGYGTQIKTGIPSNSTLIFEITLISIAPPGKELATTKRPTREQPTTLSDKTLPGDDDPKLIEVVPGLKYRDLKEGNGTKVMPGAIVTMDYTGWLLNGKVFDSSLPRQPYTTPLSGVIAGWQKGVPGMMPGGIRKLVISPELAYANSTEHAAIPPGSTLVFEVELIEAK